MTISQGLNVCRSDGFVLQSRAGYGGVGQVRIQGLGGFRGSKQARWARVWAHAASYAGQGLQLELWDFYLDLLWFYQAAVARDDAGALHGLCKSLPCDLELQYGWG